MEKLLETFILLNNITMNEDSSIEKYDSSIYNIQSLVPTWDIIYVCNGILFYFNGYACYFEKKIPCSKNNLIS